MTGTCPVGMDFVGQLLPAQRQRERFTLSYVALCRAVSVWVELYRSVSVCHVLHEPHELHEIICTAG
jgi:hypothetical protein